MSEVVSIQVEGIQVTESEFDQGNAVILNTPLDSGCQTPAYDFESDPPLYADHETRNAQSAILEDEASDDDLPAFTAPQSAQLRAVTLGQRRNQDGEIRLGVENDSGNFQMPLQPDQVTPMMRAFTQEGGGGVTGAIGFGGDEGGLVGRTATLEERNKELVSSAQKAVDDNLREQLMVKTEFVEFCTTLQEKREQTSNVVQRLQESMDAIEEKEASLLGALEQGERDRAAVRDLLISLAPLDLKAAQRSKFAVKPLREPHGLLLRSPKGPVCLTSAPQPPGAILRWRLRVMEGSSWAIGLVPISQAKDPNYLYDSAPVGLNNSDTRRSASFERRRLQDKHIEMLFNPARRTVHFYIEDETHPILFQNVEVAAEGMCLCLCTFLGCHVQLHQDKV